MNPSHTRPVHIISNLSGTLKLKTFPAKSSYSNIPNLPPINQGPHQGYYSSLASSFMPQGSFYPNHSMALDNSPGFPQLKNKQKDPQELALKKIREEKILDALEKQTELVNAISLKYKQRAEEEQMILLDRIKKLEREKELLLRERQQEDLISKRVMEKLGEMDEMSKYNHIINPYYGLYAYNPLFMANMMTRNKKHKETEETEEEEEEEEEERRRKKRKKSPRTKSRLGSLTKFFSNLYKKKKKSDRKPKSQTDSGRNFQT